MFCILNRAEINRYFITINGYSWCVAVSPCINYGQYQGGYAVGWRLYSLDQSYYQYKGGISELPTKVCSTNQSHHQYRLRYAVQDYQNCSRGWGELMVAFILDDDLLQTNPL